MIGFLMQFRWNDILIFAIKFYEGKIKIEF